ncbi:MAG: hypothetical protein ACSLFP_18250 [Acidimicrobiales bacterium]
MDLWYPPKDRPHLFEWWRPLTLASRAARLDRVPWPIHIDEFILVGRVDRPSRPAIWVYKHPEARGELYLDTAGRPYKFTRTPNAKALGRFTECDIRTAIWQARLPTAVAPMWFDDPGPAGVEWGGRGGVDGVHDEPGPLQAVPSPTAGAAPGRHPAAGRQRGHLTVYDGGGSLAG